MKVVTTNLLNRFWKNGILPIKNIFKVANNDTTTAAGWVADARIVRQHGLEIDQLSSDISGLDGEYELLASTQSASIVTLEVQSLSSYRWLLLSHYNPSTGHTDCSCMIPSCMFGTAFRDITTRYTGTGTSYIYAYGAECIYKSDTSIQLRIFRAEGGYAATLWGIT